MKTDRELLEEIHAATVKGAPASDALVNAARRVVAKTFESRGEWDDLKNAIVDLASVLERGN